MARLSGNLVSIESLTLAYRKAKVDMFFEKSQPMSAAFRLYEDDLSTKLRSLARRLRAQRPTWFKSIEFMGSYGYLPKGLKIDGSSDQHEYHFSESNPMKAWRLLLQSRNAAAEFRPVAHFTVDMYIVCALWLGTVGEKYDSCLSDAARGSRLRRILVEGDDQPGVNAYHATAPGSFQPYFRCYRDWRQDGLNAIRHELSRRHRVVAITMDLKSFYHNVDSRFLLDEQFLEVSGYNDRHTGLSAQERTFTEQLIGSFETWAAHLPTADGAVAPGVPVGPSAPRVIANVLLTQFDRNVQQLLSPIYYGRYVDDIFLVIRDTGAFRSPTDVVDHLIERIPGLRLSDDGTQLRLELPYAGKSQLIFSREKQRVFHLSGEVGQDLIDAIEAKIDEVSSEWRLLPDLDDLEKSPAARALTATKNSNDEADSLRKADSLSIRRLGFSLMLRSCDALARDLPPREWKRERSRFYRFVVQHVLTPLRLLDLHDYIHRVLGLAVVSEDWREAIRLVQRVERVIGELEKNAAASDTKFIERQWEGYRKHQVLTLYDAMLRSLPLHINQSSADEVTSLLTRIGTMAAPADRREPILDFDEARRTSLALFWSDLGRIPFKDYLLGYSSPPTPPTERHDAGSLNLDPDREARLQQFLVDVGKAPFGTRALLWPTRPLNAGEVTECLPRCISDVESWASIVRLLRGTWAKPTPEIDRTVPDGIEMRVVGSQRGKKRPRIAVTSFSVEETSWASAASGMPDLSSNRYKRLVRLANGIVTAMHRPNYVVFPELSIPRKWMPGLAHHFLRSGISMIAGVEYERIAPEPPVLVTNEAKLFLTDDRLGYPAWCIITQRKGIPAHRERDQLRANFGATFPPPNALCTKWIYDHFGFCFSVLICSELTDIRHRMAVRGGVDAQFVLSWNQDLESFSSLVEASALDVHCFMVLVNNLKYGDSRVRAPYKDSWRRDLVRVKGGLDDYFVVTDLDITSLCDYQSHFEPPADPFKPTPEGFLIQPWRRQIPGVPPK